MKRVFIAWDWELNVKATLDDCSTSDVEIISEPARDGAPISRQVLESIDGADAVVALVDFPNANVGFEIGYAAGKGKPVVLRYWRTEEPEWIRRTPFRNDPISRAQNATEIRAAIEAALDCDATPSIPAMPGADTLLLCPNVGNGEAYANVVATPVSQRFDLRGVATRESLENLLREVSRVAWLFTDPQGEVRDGCENAILAVVAGYAFALGRQVRVFRERWTYKSAVRRVADIGNEHEFRTVDELRQLVSQHLETESQDDTSVNSRPGDLENAVRAHLDDHASDKLIAALRSVADCEVSALAAALSDRPVGETLNLLLSVDDQMRSKPVDTYSDAGAALIGIALLVVSYRAVAKVDWVSGTAWCSVRAITDTLVELARATEHGGGVALEAPTSRNDHPRGKARIDVGVPDGPGFDIAQSVLSDLAERLGQDPEVNHGFLLALARRRSEIYSDEQFHFVYVRGAGPRLSELDLERLKTFPGLEKLDNVDEAEIEADVVVTLVALLRRHPNVQPVAQIRR